jgi:hypothetical protein
MLLRLAAVWVHAALPCTFSGNEEHCGCIQTAELGLWGNARAVFERGLQRHPRHALMQEKLVEVPSFPLVAPHPLTSLLNNACIMRSNPWWWLG